jgi:glycosyltransferase involved in cell wall biosynthesis
VSSSVPETSAATLTIVTICRNAQSELQDTMASVLNEPERNFEYLVVDGGSTDGTTEFLRLSEDSRLKWRSEPDQGISDAMNKGIQRATGAWILHLHAGDRLVPGALAKMHTLLAKHSDADFICSAIIKEEPSGDMLCKAAPERLPIEMAVPHPGVLVRTATLHRLGLFDQNLKNAMDYDLFLRCFVRGAVFVTSDEPIARFASGGQSDESLWKTLLETHKIRGKHLDTGWSRSPAFLIFLWTKGRIRIALQQLRLTGFVSWYRSRFSYPPKRPVSS